MERPLLIRELDGIVELTLNQPERMNALSRALVTSLRLELERLRFCGNTRVILIRGAGGKAFCAGADLKERAEMSQTEVAQFVAELRATFYLLYSHPKITIACLNGLALGGGLELALACDLRHAAAGVRLGLSETRLAIIPGAGGTQLLPRIVGPARAKELIYTARPIDAARAEAIGLVNAVHAPDQLEAAVLAEAQAICANGPIALQMAKKAIDQGLEVGLEQGLAIEQLCYAQVIPTEDRLEGLAAFKEKRPPQYKGR